MGEGARARPREGAREEREKSTRRGCAMVARVYDDYMETNYQDTTWKDSVGTRWVILSEPYGRFVTAIREDEYVPGGDNSLSLRRIRIFKDGTLRHDKTETPWTKETGQ